MAAKRTTTTKATGKQLDSELTGAAKRAKAKADRQAQAARDKAFARASELHAEGLTLGEIARTLNSEKVPTIGRADSWYAQVVRGLLVRGGVSTARRPKAAARS